MIFVYFGYEDSFNLFSIEEESVVGKRHITRSEPKILPSRRKSLTISEDPFDIPYEPNRLEPCYEDKRRPSNNTDTSATIPINTVYDEMFHRNQGKALSPGKCFL